MCEEESQTEWGLTVKAWRVTITGNWKFKPKLASGGNWSCWREWRLTLRLSSDRQWAAITAFSIFFLQFSLLYMSAVDFGVWKHPPAHGIAEVGYAAALYENMKKHLIARNVWKHLQHGIAAAAVGYAIPVTRVSNGTVGVQINLGQWRPPSQRPQCTLLAETLVTIPVVTAMGYAAAVEEHGIAWYNSSSSSGGDIVY